MSDLPAPAGRHRLAQRLILYTVLFSAALALAISTLQVIWEYRRDVSEIARTFARVEEGYLPSLAESAWLLDREQLGILVDGIQRLPDFDYAAVTVGAETVAASGERSGSGLERHWRLMRRYRDRDVQVGELTVRASLAGPRATNADRIAMVVLLNLLQIAIVAAFLFLLVRSLVTRHLERIAEYVARSDPGRLVPSLLLDRPANRTPDEFDRLVGALNATATQIRASQDQLRLAATVFESASEGIVISDAQSRIVAVNRHFSETTGYKAEEVLGQTPRILQSGRHGKAFYEEMWRQIRNQGNWSGELWNRRKDGSLYPEWLSITEVRDSAGVATHYIGMYYDLTARYAADRALRESEAELRLIMEHVPAIISYLDKDLRYRFVNKRFEEAFGRVNADVCGSHLRDVLGEPDYNRIEGHFRQALEGLSVTYQRAQRTADGELRHLRVYLVPHTCAEGRVLGCYAMTIDVSAEVQYRDELERKVAERTASLEAANRELEAFSYTVSHDLRAPLRHIAGFVGMLGELASVRADADAVRLVARAGAAASRLGGMVDELLRYARLGRQHLDFETVDVQAMVAALRDELSAGLAQRRVQWSVGTLPPVRADRTLLRLALQNLLDNALKYTRDRDPARIEVSATADANAVTLCVRDNGAGFDMRYAGKLFGTFSRLHGEAEFPGTGIGLAHVKRIVERHGGSVRAEAVPDQGAAFFVTLPLAGGR